MQFCKPHWDALRAAIDRCGLAHLVSKNGEVAMARTIKELQGADTPQDWDPLMAAHWAIATQVMDQLGKTYGPIAVFALVSGESACPLCLCRKPSCPCAQQMIDSCADHMLDVARSKGLVPEAS